MVFQSKKYGWKAGFAYSVPAEIVGGVLERIERRDGKISAKSFLDESRNQDSETHSMFEWNDEIAAEKYRLAQSGKIIRQLEITVEYDDEEIATPAFVNIESTDNVNTCAAFVNVSIAMSDKTMKQQVIKNALKELRAFERKYSRITEFSRLFDEIRSLQKGM